MVEEPGRRIVDKGHAGGGGLPWLNPVGFARRAIDLSLEDWGDAQDHDGRVFFDRGLVDAVAAYEHAIGHPPPEVEGLGKRYGRRVFLLPPWPEIYVRDDVRQHSFDSALAEYDRLSIYYPRHGYDVVIVPKATVTKRIDFVVAHLPKSQTKTPPDAPEGFNHNDRA